MITPHAPSGENPRDGEKRAAARVLVVDDEALIRWSICETLRGELFDVIEAQDGREALRMLRTEGPFSAIVLDYRLPDSNDLKLLASIRQLAPATPVVMMTAFGTPEMVRGALELGAVDVINKPFEMGEIAAIVRTRHA